MMPTIQDWKSFGRVLFFIVDALVHMFGYLVAWVILMRWVLS